MMDELDAQVDLAENFLRAGNLARAENICREVLNKRHDDLGAFECLFQIHIEKNKLNDAYELCDWRLARRPECPDTHLNKLIAYGRQSINDVNYDHVLRMKGETFMAKLRPRLANYPLRLGQAEILHALYFMDTQDARKLVKLERQKGLLPHDWLDSIETSLDVYTGNTHRSRELLIKALMANPQDGGALHDLSVVDYFRGRLFSAIKYARQARRVAPQQSAMSREVIIASLIGLIPLFWPGQVIITLTVLLAHRFEDYIATPLRFSGVILTVLTYGFIASRLMDLESRGGNIVLTVIILIGIWSCYILFSFGEIGYSLSKRAQSIKLSKKY